MSNILILLRCMIMHIGNIATVICDMFVEIPAVFWDLSEITLPVVYLIVNITLEKN